jgi:hypothetical protein
MRTKVTLILVFLNVALFFFIFKFERGWRTEQASLEARRRVLGAETADIRTLRISGPGVTTVNLVRTGDNWALTEPIEWPANPHAVSRIINELQFLEHETSFKVADLAKNNQSLADYGLAQPKLTVAFTAGDPTSIDGPNLATPVTLRIGDETKVGNRLYVLSPDGTRIHVVSQSLIRTLSLSLDELRADTVFTIPVFEARSLNLQNAANLRVRIRRDGNRWTFESPIVARANKIGVELTINALNALRVGSFVPKGTADSDPSANPSLRITLEGNNRRETLILGNPVGDRTASDDDDAAATAAAGNPVKPKADVAFYAMLEGKATLFTVSVPGALLNALRNAQEVLREARILDFDPSAVTAISLAAPNQPSLTLQRLETGAQPADNLSSWQIVSRNAQQGPQTQPADSEAVQTLLKKLSLLAAQKFVSDAPSDADLETWGFNRPEREVALTLGSGTTATTLTLQLGVTSGPESHTYARIGSARFVYLVDAGILEATSVSPLDYRDRLLRELPAAARISELSITDLGHNTVIFDQKLPDTGPKAGTPVQVIVDQLRQLHAKRFVQDQFTASVIAGGEERLWRYRLDATIVLPGGNGSQQEVMKLFFTQRVGGAQQLAGSADFGAVFEVEQPLLDAMWQLTYGDKDPGAPPPPPPETAAKAVPQP